VAVAGAVVIALILSGGQTPPVRKFESARSTVESTTLMTAGVPSTTSPSTLPPPGPGFVAGHVTAIGDSVMLDYQATLQADIPGVIVQAETSRAWSAGETLVAHDKADGRLGAEVVVALGTNGPITAADFDAMMRILQGASRVLFVNLHVDQPWQDPNNAVLAAGVARYPNAVLADWFTLATQHPDWTGPDGTHLAMNGPGATALASLIATTLSNG
jgi:hypothetical protein